MTTVCPSATASPTLTSIFHTVPVMCAFTLEPWRRESSGRLTRAASVSRHRRRHVEGELARRCSGARGRARRRCAPRTTAGTARPTSRRAWQAATAKPATRDRAAPGTRRRTGAAQPAQPSPSGGARRQLAIDDDQRAVGPPRAEHGVNLQAQRSRAAEAGRAPEALERNQRRRAVEREVDARARPRAAPSAAPTAASTTRCGEAIERVGRAVGRLGRSRAKRSKNAGPPEPTITRRARARQQRSQAQRRASTPARRRRRTPPPPAARATLSPQRRRARARAPSRTVARRRSTSCRAST